MADRSFASRSHRLGRFVADLGAFGILVVYFQIADHLYNAFSVPFYYRPIALTLPLVVGLGTFRRLEKSFAFPDSDNAERLSQGFGFVTLISYLCLAATIMEFVVRFHPK